jgi:prevent-host-death family protein
MRRVSVRELSRHTADVLAFVERGERIEITRNGTRVAVFEPAVRDPLRGLMDTGQVRPARGALPLFTDAVVSDDSAGLKSVLDDRYGPGRY